MPADDDSGGSASLTLDNRPSHAFEGGAIIAIPPPANRWNPALSDLVPLPATDLALAAGYARQALAPATLRAYASDWATFTA